MRTIVAAAMALTLVTAPALAQMPGKRGPHQAPQQHQPADDQKKQTDKAYKSALEKIPDSKEAVDPWKNVRPAGTNTGGR